MAAASLTSIELGIQPLLHTVNGAAQYAPYGLTTAILAMVGSHALIVGPIEAAFTVAVFAVLRRQSPELFEAGAGTEPLRRRWLVGLLAVFIAAVPLGLLAERRSVCRMGQRRARPAHRLRAPGSRAPGRPLGWPAARLWLARRGGAWAVVSYLVSALVGVALLTAIVWLAVRLRRRAARTQVAQPPANGAR